MDHFFALLLYRIAKVVGPIAWFLFGLPCVWLFDRVRALSEEGSAWRRCVAEFAHTPKPGDGHLRGEFTECSQDRYVIRNTKTFLKPCAYKIDYNTSPGSNRKIV